MTTPEAFQPTAERPLLEGYKRELHEYVQGWGDRVAPALENMPQEERAAKEPFFQWLIECVPRGDHLTADLIKSLDLQFRDLIGYSYYTERTHSISDDHPMLIQANQRQFETLFAIYEAGKESK